MMNPYMPTDTLGRKNDVKRGPKHRKGRYLGVYKYHSNNGATDKWYANITVDSRRRYLGLFGSAKEAAVAYDKVARIEHGKKATLNFKNPGSEPRRKIRKASPFVGAYKNSNGKWFSQINIKSSGMKYLGVFGSRAAASAAYKAAKKRYLNER